MKFFRELNRNILRFTFVVEQECVGVYLDINALMLSKRNHKKGIQLSKQTLSTIVIHKKLFNSTRD